MGVDYTKQYEPDQMEPFFPNEIVKMGIVVLCTLAVIMFLVVLPTLLEMGGVTGVFHEEQPADPSTTPPHIRPEWYFLSVYQYLKLMPRELLGIDGKALGIFTQGLGMLMLLGLPFWFPLHRAAVRSGDWPKGVAAFGAALGAFVAGAAVMLTAQAGLSDPMRSLLHPMFVWPPLAVVAYVAAGWIGRRMRVPDVWAWMKLLTGGLLLVAFQFVTFVVVLGQALAGVLGPELAYGLGMVCFAGASLLVVAMVIHRATTRKERPFAKGLAAFITEVLLLFIGLTVWAMWPVEGLWGEHGLAHEAKGFLFSLGIMAAAVIVFVALIATERRTIRKTLGSITEEEPAR